HGRVVQPRVRLGAAAAGVRDDGRLGPPAHDGHRALRDRRLACGRHDPRGQRLEPDLVGGRYPARLADVQDDQRRAGQGGDLDDGTAAGQAAEYGSGSLSQATQALNQPAGTFVDFAANQAGSQVLFDMYSQSGAPCPYYAAWVLDTATRTLTEPKTPAGGGPD